MPGGCDTPGRRQCGSISPHAARIAGVGEADGMAGLVATTAAARTIAALVALRDQVIAPILADGHSPPLRTQARALERHRPRLRNPPHRHAGSLRRPRDHADRRPIDNILSIGEMQAARAPSGLQSTLSSARLWNADRPSGKMLPEPGTPRADAGICRDYRQHIACSPEAEALQGIH
jgi:hypothetical protein